MARHPKSPPKVATPEALPSAACSLFLLPISQEPRPGQRVIVHLKDGESRECTATLMHTNEGTFTQYFHRRRAIDINQIAGWTNAENRKNDQSPR